MILSDGTIRSLLAEGTVVIDPLDDMQIGPASVDLRLGTIFLTPRPTKAGIYSLAEEIEYDQVEGNDFIIPTHGFVLATTVEFLKLPADLTAFVEGRSSIGRSGLFIQNAGWVDPGFEGAITLELYNANAAPMRIISGWRICQLVIAKADAPVLKPYRGKYQGQQVTTGSRAFLDEENARR
ncbi:MAG: dCTP deaminase [Candidatus Hydrogenedentes bacterium]|nr:dCTP deaminase [Candidatus Hydrogenedentota bacterium]